MDDAAGRTHLETRNPTRSFVTQGSDRIRRKLNDPGEVRQTTFSKMHKIGDSGCRRRRRQIDRCRSCKIRPNRSGERAALAGLGHDPHVPVKAFAGAIGLFDASVDPNEINIPYHPPASQRFEDGHGCANPMDKTLLERRHAAGTSWFHWADNLDGIDFPDEEGAQFRNRRLGMVINE